jgi:hypothetical protein
MGRGKLIRESTKQSNDKIARNPEAACICKYQEITTMNSINLGTIIKSAKNAEIAQLDFPPTVLDQ